MSCPISEIENVLNQSNQAPVTLERLSEFLQGVVNGVYSIAHYGACNWSKGIDDYSTGMNIVSNWYTDRLEMKGPTNVNVKVNVQGAMDILGHIRYGANNFINENGMKTIHELAAVGISYLGGNPYENRT
jgi:hypothetical protein